MHDEAFGKRPPSGAVAEAREDELRRASSRRRRRAVLGMLRAAGTPITIDGLSNQIARGERRLTTDGQSSDDPRTIRRSHYRAHLPERTAANVVDCDRSNHTVGLGPPDAG